MNRGREGNVKVCGGIGLELGCLGYLGIGGGRRGGRGMVGRWDWRSRGVRGGWVMG